MRILVIEDNARVAGAVRAMLERRKYAVDVAPDGDTGLDHLLRQTYDAAIVDIVLPNRDGFAIAAAARTNGIQTPLLMLTARDAVEDRVRGLDSGADDYLVKPFEEEELVARVRALLRRADRPVKDLLRSGDLAVDVSARQASYAGKNIPLGLTEFRMLEFFARNAGLVLSREHLLERVWEYEFDGSSNIVDVYVSQLRRKLKRAGAGDVIKTVWGVGYRFQP
ncbi:MAG TPA: response regulator transcription factor [Candidatus Baltobacteraceae bacterium]|nr:response regulator transcription factor [Candidatus Baltobacteraceae bacterium]